MKTITLVSILLTLIFCIPANSAWQPYTGPINSGIYHNDPPEEEPTPEEFPPPPIDDFEIGQTGGQGWFVEIDPNTGEKIWVQRHHICFYGNSFCWYG